MSNMEQYFAGMESAKSMGGGQYFKSEGRFLLTTKRIFVNDGHKGRFFIAEFEVNESTTATDPKGCTRSWSVPLIGERAKYSFADIKNLVFALMGRNPKDCGSPEENPALHQGAKEIVLAACDPTGECSKKFGIDAAELIGLQVQLETNMKVTRPKPGAPQGGLFTVHTWSPVTD